MEAIVNRVVEWTNTGVCHVAVGVNADVCNRAATEPSFRAQVNSADLAYADGQSVVWAGRALGLSIPERVATTDLIYPLMVACASLNKRVFLFGGAPGVADDAAKQLRILSPGLQIDVHDGYLPTERMGELVELVRSRRPDVLLVGLGDPLQQAWVARYREHLEVPAILTCGGLFDWTSGRMRRAPRWFITLGLEWLWRLRLEPRRLARRYLVGNPMFVLRFIRSYIRLRVVSLFKVGSA